MFHHTGFQANDAADEIDIVELGGQDADRLIVVDVAFDRLLRVLDLLTDRRGQAARPTNPNGARVKTQVQVTLTRGFWMCKYEATQGQWKRLIGRLPGNLTAELPEGDDFPVGNVNFAEAEAFCRKLRELGHQSGVLPKDWEFRLPTEAQWEYACQA